MDMDDLEFHTNSISEVIIESVQVTSESEVFSRTYSELVIICSGSATLVTEGKEYLVHSGNLFVINTEAGYRYINANGLFAYRMLYCPEHVFSLFPDMKKLAGVHTLFVLLPSHGIGRFINSQYHLKPSALEFSRSLMHGMINELTQKSDGYQISVLCLLISVMIFLCREFAHTNIPGETYLYELSKAITHIEKNYMLPITLKELSVIAAISERHFDRIFKSIYNVSPFEYIKKLRLSKAYSLLQSSGLGVTQVAGECGFPDSNYFSRCFKAEFGITPMKVKSLGQAARTGRN